MGLLGGVAILCEPPIVAIWSEFQVGKFLVDVRQNLEGIYVHQPLFSGLPITIPSHFLRTSHFSPIVPLFGHTLSSVLKKNPPPFPPPSPPLPPSPQSPVRWLAMLRGGRRPSHRSAVRDDCCASRLADVTGRRGGGVWGRPGGAGWGGARFFKGGEGRDCLRGPRTMN